MSTLLIKTDLARLALAPGIRTLTPRERTLVLLADGQRSAHDLLALVAGATADLVHSLVERGFLAAGAAVSALSPPETASPAPAPAAAGPLPAEPSPREAPAASATPWARSPAATKLYLIDLAERTFARSDPAQWEFLRELLREVRDDEGLMQAMALVTQAIARVSGEERARLVRIELLRA
ncbi:hypothetical protein [Caldimonas tepidiphila]|uniref:hypothetical protein n=1 Tax=Caldimonas tepidiphila TaxID=2315841 RepID=UPI000E5A81ED|nr:hypothetical protein [Caldimonas tepidiphila]